MTRLELNEDGDPIFYLAEVDPPESYPRHLTDNLRAKYDYLFAQYYQLRDLWEVQLKDYRDHWNIKAAYDFWMENGRKTIHGRHFGWSEEWLIDAIADVREELIDLEDAGNRIRMIKEATRITIDLLASVRATRVRDDGLRRMRKQDSSTSASTELESPTHKPPHRPSRLDDALLKKKRNHHYSSPSLGSREDPIIIGLDSDDDDDDDDDDDEGGRPHRGRRQRRTQPLKIDKSQRRRPPLKPSANTRLRRRNCSPEHSHAHDTAGPRTPVKLRRERANMTSPQSLSPSKKRALSKDGKGSERARKSPKHSNSSSGSKSSPGSVISSGDGGCLLKDEKERWS